MINGFVWTSLVPQNSVVYHNFPLFYWEDTAVGLTCVTFMLVAGARPTNLTLTSMLGETRPQATRLEWLRRFVPTSAVKTSPKSTAIRQLSCWQTLALQRNSTSLFVLVYLVAHAPGDWSYLILIYLDQTNQNSVCNLEDASLCS